MSAAMLSIYDEVAGLERQPRFTIHLASERVTARELIERRVREEVARYNATLGEEFFGLVQPDDAERLLNGYRMRTPRRISADEQCKHALSAFRNHGFLLLVNDRQVESLDEPLILGDRTDLTFLKLVPLVGG